MADFKPADDLIRQRIRNAVDVNMCVEAGAGTGKTTVLVDRIVQIIARGHAAMPNIAVITFTEKAAAELSARVRQGLHDAVDTAADDASHERLAGALRTLSQAHIETIHAFAASMLRERPIEAELDPGFEVLADLQAQLDFEEEYDEWLTGAMAADPPPAALLEALNVGLDFALVRDAAEKLHAYRDLMPLPAHTSEPVNVRGALDAILAELDEVRDLAPRKGVTDEAYEAMLDAYQQFDAIAALEGDAVLRRTMAAAVVRSGGGGNQKNWNDADDCRNVKAALKRVGTLLADCRGRLRGHATANLVHWLEGFVEHYEERRKRDGKADFQDLLLMARNLLRGSREVRRYFQEKYRCVLVDEFQDTDPLQVEMVIYLCAQDDGIADWRTATLRPGSLFVVGDPKQSIYRFRRADIAMYDEVRGSLFGGKPLEIGQNFRSVREIIDWVNGVFTQLIQEQPRMQPKYIDLVAREALVAPDAQSVTLVRGVVPVKSATETRRVEAAALASLIAREVEAGAWHVRGDDGTPRPATYRDVVMLIPRRTELEYYEEALASAGVPFRHEGGRSFFLRQEVRELVAVLRAIDDPSDAVAAVAALRSSAFGCSDEDLLLYRDGGGRFDRLHVPATDAGPVADSLRTLRVFAELRHETPLPEIVRAVLDRTRLVEFALLQPQGEQVAGNLLKIIDQARAFGEARGGGLRAFVRWQRENIARSADETDASTSEETDDVVRIMTIYAAKGLEFPIVVFANMNTEFADRTTVIADRAGGGDLHVQLGRKTDAFRTPGFDAAAESEQAHRAAEDARLLYVAATRARDRLVVPLFKAEGGSRSKEKKTAPSLCDRLRSAGADAGDEVEVVDAASLPPLAPDVPVWKQLPDVAPQPEIQRVIKTRAAWQSEHRAEVAAANAPLRYATASALKPEWQRPSLAGDEVRRGRATDLGSAVHALLERIDLARPDDATAMATTIAEEFGLAGREAEIEQLARSALASDVVRRALEPETGRVLREAPFTVALPEAGGIGGIAEGRIDLLFERDGEMTVVDFKTDRVAGAEIDRRTATYRNQALVYAWATQQATGRPVREVIFVYASPGVERAIAVDAAFMAEAETLMREAALPFD